MYGNMIEYVFCEMGRELLLNPNCKKKYLEYNGDKIIVYVSLHNKNYTKLLVMCDYDAKTDKYTTRMNFNLKNNYYLIFECIAEI